MKDFDSNGLPDEFESAAELEAWDGPPHWPCWYIEGDTWQLLPWVTLMTRGALNGRCGPAKVSEEYAETWERAYTEVCCTAMTKIGELQHKALMQDRKVQRAKP